MGNQRRTPAYILFYILFLPDSWQILMGMAAAYFGVPAILPPDKGLAVRLGLYVMIATIGYAASRPVARKITLYLKKIILGDKYLRRR